MHWPLLLQFAFVEFLIWINRTIFARVKHSSHEKQIYYGKISVGDFVQWSGIVWNSYCYSRASISIRFINLSHDMALRKDSKLRGSAEMLFQHASYGSSINCTVNTTDSQETTKLTFNNTEFSSFHYVYAQIKLI